MDEVRLSDEEKKLIERAAQQNGLTIEQYLKKVTQEFFEQRLGTPKAKVNKCYRRDCE